MVSVGRVLVVPQWQGSASEGAWRLPVGARHLAGLFPGARVDVAEVAAEGSDTRGGVRNLAALTESFAVVRRALETWDDAPLLTVGGDCGIEIAPIATALAAHGRNLAVVWLDAHADLNTPRSSPSGAFHGMVLRSLLGDGPEELALGPRTRLEPAQVVLAGVRALDPEERDFIAENKIRRVSVAQLADPAALVEAVASTGASMVYIHLDLDVIDPGYLRGLSFPEPAGAEPDHIRAAIEALTARFGLAGLGITEYAPTVLSAAEDRVLARILGLP
ncbi:arginase family protein [Nocardia sp. ET3-3]|uniref:Arginase family protein n=1 Tax=Nocardia terrae TaxID=2675851 RepID=A0A7K1V220_9NOCA|nr:arginase family protein [Nocardia terrae]MVU80567.1 arginase family protein [Nocardia terrae]